MLRDDLRWRSAKLGFCLWWEEEPIKEGSLETLPSEAALSLPLSICFSVDLGDTGLLNGVKEPCSSVLDWFGPSNWTIVAPNILLL